MKVKHERSFRQEAIRLALSGDKSISQTAHDLGIKETTLYYWVHQAKKDKAEVIVDEKKLTSAELIDELTRLRKENSRLREEREILKKAAVFFAKEEQKR